MKQIMNECGRMSGFILVIFTLCILSTIFLAVYNEAYNKCHQQTKVNQASQPPQNLVDEAADLRGPDAKTLADYKWPMSPPQVEVMSDWRSSFSERYRYVKIDGYLAIESQTSLSFCVISFVPPEIAAELEAKYQAQSAEAPPLKTQQ